MSAVSAPEISVLGAAWQWVNDSGAALGALAAIAAAVVAVRALRAAAYDSRERSRPNMLAELRHVPYARGSLDLAIRNAGPSVARDVEVTFTPPLPREALEAQFITARYERVIPTFAPGQELTNTWLFQAPEAGTAGSMPVRTTVTITYRGGGRRQQHTDIYELDADVLSHQTVIDSSASPEGRLRAIAEGLTKIQRTLVALDRTLNRRASGSDEP